MGLDDPLEKGMATLGLPRVGDDIFKQCVIHAYFCVKHYSVILQKFCC